VAKVAAALVTMTPDVLAAFGSAS